MLFNSYSFLIFCPIVLAVYYIIPKRIKYLWLLVASYYFYMCWNPIYLLLLMGSTIATYIGAIGVERYEQLKVKKIILSTVLFFNLAILSLFKYGDFFIYNLNRLLSGVKMNVQCSYLNFILPVGISFYTFQAIGYLMDVYKGTVKAEKNLAKYALFVSFFPQLVAGPIERSGNLLRQINEIGEKRLWNYDKFVRGFILAVWGFFLKMVIADRLSVFVDSVYESYQEHRAWTLILVAMMFSLQIYCDFCGYSSIAIGVSRMLGIELMENFNTPFFAENIKEFWNRWHISLSTWFRDYLYIPMGGSRCSKWKHYRNLFITFLVSGLWHGAALHYVAWGAVHGLYQILGAMTLPIRKRLCTVLEMDRKCVTHRIFNVIGTFLLVSFAFIFFRSQSVGEAFRYIMQMTNVSGAVEDLHNTLGQFGGEGNEKMITIISLFILFMVSLVRRFANQTIDVFWKAQNILFRWGFAIALLCMIVIWGKYGAGYDAQQFIYFQF